MQLVVTADGSVRFVYAETVDLRSLGPTTIHRGSYVEPDAMGRWLVDLGPVDPVGRRSQFFQRRRIEIGFTAAGEVVHE